jgi:hypothetical protein
MPKSRNPVSDKADFSTEQVTDPARVAHAFSLIEDMAAAGLIEWVPGTNKQQFRLIETGAVFRFEEENRGFRRVV